MSQDFYLDFVTRFADLGREILPVPQDFGGRVFGTTAESTHPVRDQQRRCALLFSPHPDDECLFGGLPLRLLQEENWQIISVAVTLGSAEDRREARWQELQRACAITGFEPLQSVPLGFSGVRRDTIKNFPDRWDLMARRVGEILLAYNPDAVFMHHPHDIHRTHVGTHDLVMAGMALLPSSFSCHIALTEYWQPNEKANNMTALSAPHVACLLKALACYSGENVRNPYDVRFPPYLMDNVRRGGELLSGHGAAVPDYDFAMLYRIGQWQNGAGVFNTSPQFLSLTMPPSMAFLEKTPEKIIT